jgi:hypothetical protein
MNSLVKLSKYYHSAVFLFLYKRRFGRWRHVSFGQLSCIFPFRIHSDATNPSDISADRDSHVARLIYITHKNIPAAGFEPIFHVFKIVNVFLYLKYKTVDWCTQQRLINCIKNPMKKWL